MRTMGYALEQKFGNISSENIIIIFCIVENIGNLRMKRQDLDEYEGGTQTWDL